MDINEIVLDIDDLNSKIKHLKERLYLVSTTQNKILESLRELMIVITAQDKKLTEQSKINIESASVIESLHSDIHEAVAITEVQSQRIDALVERVDYLESYDPDK